MEKKREDYLSYQSDELTLCDRLCDVCIYRDRKDPSVCQKYPNGKPDEMLDPDAICIYFAMTDLQF